MNKEEKIRYIEEEIGDKTLSFGCRVTVILRRYNKLKKNVESLDIKIWKILDRWNNCYLWGGNIQIIDDIDNVDFWKELEDCQDFNNTNILYYLWKILWHPVMIWDVLYFLEKQEYKAWYPTWYSTVLLAWREKRKDISEQSDACIDYIVDLISKYKQWVEK